MAQGTFPPFCILTDLTEPPAFFFIGPCVTCLLMLERIIGMLLAPHLGKGLCEPRPLA